MKKIFSLVLAMVVAMSAVPFALAAETETIAEGTSVSSTGEIELKPEIDDRSTVMPEGGVAELGKEYFISYSLGSSIGSVDKFDGKTGETTNINMNYVPKGVNGIELIKANIRYNMSSNSYDVRITTVPNPTVEIFKGLEIKITFNKQVDGKTYTKTETLPIHTLMNSRHTYSDVLTAASGYKYIFAEHPVIDATVFDQNTGQQLQIDYNDYNMIFKKVTNQNTALYLGATYSYATTGTAKENEPIIQLGFENIIVKDEVTIQLRFKADQQNYTGSNVWVYDIVDGKPKGVGYRATIASDSSVMVTVPANTALSSLGVYATEQNPSNNSSDSGSSNSSNTSSVTSTTSTSSISSNGNYANSKTGFSDVVNIAVVFAGVSLVIAGFVAIRKVSR